MIRRADVAATLMSAPAKISRQIKGSESAAYKTSKARHPYGALHRAVVDPVQRFLEGSHLLAVIIALILAASLAGARRWKKDRDDQHRLQRIASTHRVGARSIQRTVSRPLSTRVRVSWFAPIAGPAATSPKMERQLRLLSAPPLADQFGLTSERNGCRFEATAGQY